eukprot:scaffold5143_cov119-Isochrysis_galbana.AAC.13
MCDNRQKQLPCSECSPIVARWAGPSGMPTVPTTDDADARCRDSTETVHSARTIGPDSRACRRAQ